MKVTDTDTEWFDSLPFNDFKSVLIESLLAQNLVKIQKPIKTDTDMEKED